MEKFVVSARKYRPTTFDSVVGQKSITNTLKNAIKTNHLAQAFLFCGSRGVGKTTCARILAKTINCSNRKENVEACNECESCRAFNDGNSLNISELDAASNNSVDDIRNLTDQVRFAPQIGNYKVYIIDEVHMLSTAAFNAFLKTLEEPPAHAIFILATTEKHKILPTILSRCQIFDFNRIEIDDIATHLKEIAQKEGIEAEEEGLHIIAQKADGALRDALSIFDQIVSFAGKSFTYDDVIANLNILDYDFYFKATDFLLKNDIPNSLLIFNDILARGFDGHLFINGLASHFRNLLVCQDEATVKLLEVGRNIKERYYNQAKSCDLKFLLPAIEICRQCDVQYKGSKNQRLLVELSLMQIASITSEDFASQEKKKPKISTPKPSETAEKPAVTTTEAVKVEGSAAVEKKPVEHSTSKKETAAVNKEEKELTTKPDNNIEAAEKPNRLDRLSKLKGRKSAFSIKQLTKEEEKEAAAKKESEESSGLETDFSDEDFLATWKLLAERIKKSEEEGNSIVYAAMSARAPIRLEGNQILLKVDNKSQYEEIIAKRTGIHDFLRRKLKNGLIQLDLEIIKDQKERKAYTDEEKFDEMAEENPILNDLKRTLNLDFI